MPSLPFVASYACARNPDGALGKIIAARKQRALAGCKREGAVCICNTINFVTKSFLTSPETLSYITLCIYVCPYIYLLKFLMNHLFSCCFEITITPGASGPHAASHIRGAASWRPMLLAVSSFVRWTGGVWIVERHRSQKIYRSSEENRSKWVRFRIATYRSTIPYSALQFRRNSPVFWCFEIPRVPGHEVACRACVRIPMYLGL